MPKIPPNYLDCVFYLYETPEKAAKGVSFGGTGFIILLPSTRVKNLVHSYAITNWHVAVRDGMSAIRLNTESNGVEVFDFGPEDWTFDPAYDIAAIPLASRTVRHKITAIHLNAFATKEWISASQLGVGDNVFMVGRFVDHDGGQTNRPAARFGNISMMPSPIMQPNGKMADSYCVDLHSRSGYSGSPVFVYRTIGGDLEASGIGGGFPAPHPNFLGLLGIHWGQFPEIWQLTSREKLAEGAKNEPLILDGQYVKGVSGMTCVLPAWSILDVLNTPSLTEARRHADAQAQAHIEKHGYPAEGEVSPSAESELPTTADNLSHKED